MEQKEIDRINLLGLAYKPFLIVFEKNAPKIYLLHIYICNLECTKNQNFLFFSKIFHARGPLQIVGDT
ncbi:Uncharacterised protein [Chlamydia trachomatis]|nr:Uncharacterised protein [Chlamydia trachomatis]